MATSGCLVVASGCLVVASGCLVGDSGCLVVDSGCLVVNLTRNNQNEYQSSKNALFLEQKAPARKPAHRRPNLGPKSTSHVPGFFRRVISAKGPGPCQAGRKAIRKPSTRFGNQGPRFGNHDSETRDPDRFGNQETTIRKPNWKLMVFVMVMVG